MTFTEEQIEAVCCEAFGVAPLAAVECTSEQKHAARLILQARAERDIARMWEKRNCDAFMKDRDAAIAERDKEREHVVRPQRLAENERLRVAFDKCEQVWGQEGKRLGMKMTRDFIRKLLSSLRAAMSVTEKPDSEAIRWYNYQNEGDDHG